MVCDRFRGPEADLSVVTRIAPGLPVTHLELPDAERYHKSHKPSASSRPRYVPRRQACAGERYVRPATYPTLPGSFSRMQTSLRTVRRVDTTARAQALNVPARSRGQPVPSPTMRQGYHLQRLSAVVPRTTDSRPRSFGRARDRRSEPAVPLVLRRIAVAKANAYR